jgi:hypothetical protein
MVAEEQDLEDMADSEKDSITREKHYRYEDLDVDIVDNTDYDNEDGSEQKEEPEKQRSFSNEFIKSEIREQLNYERKQKLKKS